MRRDGAWIVKLARLGPCFDRDDPIADARVLFDVHRPVHDLVPDGRVVGPVHYVDLHFDGAR